MKTEKTYAGIPVEYTNPNKAKIVLILVPFDGTSTWGKGADKGPEAFLDASENMELYDIETDSEVYKNGIYLTEPLALLSTPEAMVNEVYKYTKSQIIRNKFVTLFGGEHSISIGAIRAFDECFDNLTVLQIDAHADLRKTYEGTPYNHACAMYEASQNTNLVQVGIRSMDVSEKTVMNKENVFFAKDMVSDEYWMTDAIDVMTNNVYITFDLDAFDPSILSATGTPEPGGLLWYETLEFLRKVFKEKNVVGFDVVELCPNHYSQASNFTAAKLYYKMLSYKFENVDIEEEDNFYQKEEKKKTVTKFKDLIND
ncbi:agmatinase [Wenyingzhuangia sp. IMCC45533]